MQRRTLLLAPALSLALALLGAPLVAGGGGPPREARAPLKVFILAGQSNMVGHGIVGANPERNGGKGSLEFLVEDDATAERFAHLIDREGDWIERDDVWITFRDRSGPLTVGYGANEDKIGPELGLGHVLGEHLDEPVLLLKVAWGGKSVAVDFRPPSAGGEVGEFYTMLFAEIRLVLDELDDRLPDAKYSGVELCGIAWHQGWNDRIDQEFNDEYESNLSHFIEDAREELESPDLPFVIAETGMTGPDEKHPRALSLMAAQKAVAEREQFDGTVGFVKTQEFWRPQEESPSGQGYHWNTNAETYYLIGEGLGKAMVELLGEDD